MRAGLVIIVVIVAVFAVVGVTGAAVPPAAESMKVLQGVNFVSTCKFSHRLMDDPIVSPKTPGASHDHTFVGNRTTNAYSTTRTLRAGGTTCMRAGDTAAYWMPTLLESGRPVEPLGATIYYRRRTLEPVRPFPVGLKMIAGLGHAFTPQSLKVTFWNCGVAGGIKPTADVPTCPAGRATSLRLHVNFPNCWDGKQLDSRNHQSHMAYAQRGICPVTHPVAVPAISLIFRYPVSGGSEISLASGGHYSSHADFFNAWHQGTLRALVGGCLNALRHCGRGI